MMSEWQTIDSAPTDGTTVKAGKMSRMFGDIGVHVPYALASRFIDGRWTAEFSKGHWHPYDPQPTHWRPVEQTTP